MKTTQKGFNGGSSSRHCRYILPYKYHSEPKVLLTLPSFSNTYIVNKCRYCVEVQTFLKHLLCVCACGWVGNSGPNFLNFL